MEEVERETEEGREGRETEEGKGGERDRGREGERETLLILGISSKLQLVL